MELLIDADALIKLNRAGLLKLATEVFDCSIPTEVYIEVVVKGQAYGHTDAEEIQEAIKSGINVRLPPSGPSGEHSMLDRGERAVLDLVLEGEPGVVVSDDRRFVNFLSRAGIPHLVPAALIIVMVRQLILTTDEAIAALNRLQPFIRIDSYVEALQELNGLTG